MALVEDGTLLGPRQLDMGNSGYIVLAKFTEQGIRNIRDLPQRWINGRKSIEAVGGSIQ